MNNNQKLTGIVLLVVAMAVMFGLHTTFLLVETAEATHSSYSCKYKLHRVYGMSIANQYNIFGTATIDLANCATCTDESPSPHVRLWYYDRETITKWYEHKYLIGLFWTDCHKHIITTDTWYSYIVLCEQPE